jgi:hypothetical protein
MRHANLLLSLTVLWASSSGAQVFDDVPADYWAYNFVEILVANGITAGCGNDNFCPEDSVSRDQMAVFLERGMNGSGYVPPPATGNVFLDVGAGDFAAGFIEQLYNDGITAGCGNNSYCPDAEVSRAQMAVFLLRAKYGSGYSPPAATGVFSDVDLSYWAVHWIEALASEGITAGCGNGNFCPEGTVTRAQMAVFLVRTFGLVTPPDADATLTSMSVSAGALDPAFDPDRTSYTIVTTASSYSVTPTASVEEALIVVNTIPVASGSTLCCQPLSLGENTLTVVVVATSGLTTRTYTVNIFREST